MDRNTITGLVVIALILIGYSYFMSPSKEELKAMHVRDELKPNGPRHWRKNAKQILQHNNKIQKHCKPEQRPSSNKILCRLNNTPWKIIKSNYTSTPKGDALTMLI